MVTDKNRIKIAVLPGDGIGIDVTQAAIPVIEALNIPVTLHFGDIGWRFWQQEGAPIPTRTWELIDNSDVILLGAATSKPPYEAHHELPKHLQKENPLYLSPIIQLRKKLDLFANVRPCFNIQTNNKFNFCIIRENTEGLYAGLDYHPLPESLHHFITQNSSWQSLTSDELSCSLRLQTNKGLKRIFEFAFNYAEKNHIKRVTFADKPNVLRKSGTFARELFEKTANLYPNIKCDILNVDAVALWLIKRPEEFGVIVAENMFGDILSDVGAGVMGGLGLAPSANIGQNKCYFEPVHGSAPRVKSNSANPSAMFLSISLMLEHLGFQQEADKIKQSVIKTIKEDRFLTYDLGGNASTSEMANMIIDNCQQGKISAPSITVSNNKWEKLAAFSSAEISDALDSCEIEGALLDIKPLTAGTKLIGPAYTVVYSSYNEKPRAFRNAANYIDQAPEKAVIVIDNQGRVDCTVWGDILTHTAIQKGINGTVVNGAVRDVELIRNCHYALFCKNYYMRSGKNRVYKSNEQVPLKINNVAINPGDIIFGDDNGVLVIPLHRLDEIITKATNIKNTEQKIISAITAGSSLKQARKNYGYDQPWFTTQGSELC